MGRGHKCDAGKLICAREQPPGCYVELDGDQKIRNLLWQTLNRLDDDQFTKVPRLLTVICDNGRPACT